MRVMRPASGFSLVELLIGIAIMTLLLLLGGPGVAEFLVNTRIRSASDAIANGVRQARLEAVKRNKSMDFVLGAGQYTIQDPGPPAVTVSTEPLFDVGNVTATATPVGADTVRFSALGQYDSTIATPLQIVDITSGAISSPHPLRVVIDPALGVGLRVCDPAKALPDPVGCP